MRSFLSFGRSIDSTAVLRSRRGCTGSPPTPRSMKSVAGNGARNRSIPTDFAISTFRPRPAANRSGSSADSTSTPRSLDCPRISGAAVILRDVADLDYSEIADTLSIPIGTVRSRIARWSGRAGARSRELPTGPGRPRS